MKYASIDIGTNTLRLLIAEAAPGGGMKPLVYKRAITRLGGGYSAENGIDPASAERSLEALEGFRRIIDENGVAETLATATSVVRRAVNRERFTDEVLRKTGIAVRVISGDEEARLSLLGVLSVIEDGSRRKAVFDIGGGSTEFIFTEGDELKGAWSMEMGVVHLTERHLKSDPPARAELKGLEEEVRGVIGSLKRLMDTSVVDRGLYRADRGAVLVGTAGTITTLAALAQGLEVYDRQRINNYTLTKEKVRSMYSYLAGLKLREREQVLSLEKGREDLIIPGSAIALETMEAFGFEELKVSDAGLLEGIILDRLKG